MSQDRLIAHFAFDHLPAHLRATSELFHDLAVEIYKLPANPERTVALRKLLESKDCAVRAVIEAERQADPPAAIGCRVNGRRFIGSRFTSYAGLCAMGDVSPALTPTVMISEGPTSRSAVPGDTTIELCDGAVVTVIVTSNC